MRNSCHFSLVQFPLITNFCVAEIKTSVEPVEDRTTAECQSPSEESKVGANDDLEENSAVSHDQNIPKESTATSSPDTDSPVMINVDVSLKVELNMYQLSDMFLSEMLNHQWFHVVDAGGGLR